MSPTKANSAAAVAIDPPESPVGARKQRARMHVAAGKRATAAPRPEMSAPATRVQHWLDWQCRMISGVHSGAVFLVRNAGVGGFKPTAVWPDKDVEPSTLRAVAEQAINRGRQVVQKEAADQRPNAVVADFVAYPLFHKDTVVGAVSLALAVRSETQRQAVMQLLQWGTVWLEQAVNSESADRGAASSLALDLIGLLARDVPLAVVGQELCNLLAERFECSRAALGTWSGLQVRVLSMSHQIQFDRRVSHVEQIEFAMEECVDQGQAVFLPSRSKGEKALSQAHAQLLQEGGSGSVCTVPLGKGDESVGALTLMRDDKRGFDDKSREILQFVAQSVAPLIRLKQREARTGAHRALQALREAGGHLLGKGHLRLKLVVAGVVLLLGLLLLIRTDHRIAADSTIEGALQQAVVAPFNGYLSSASARAGDEVKEGQVLAVLDDRDLLLEQEKWSSERDKHSKEYQQALASRDRAKVSIMAARIAQADAQLHLVEKQMLRTRLRAPFAGVLVSGDLSRALGAPLERGQLLFEIVPNAGYHVSLAVDEHDVAALEKGQQASLRLTGLPNQVIPLRISRILPVASAEGGGNHFRVEAELQEAPPGLRPGMEGVAKVVVGRGSLLSVWTASLRDRLRLWFWSLGL